VTDQEFSKRGPSQGPGKKQNEAISEAKCEISVYTCAILNVFSKRNFLKGDRAKGQERSKMKQSLKQNVKLAYIRVQFLTFSCTKFRI